MNLVDLLIERRMRQWARWERDHRWDKLAAYNTRVAQGVVHTPEYAERMRDEQAAFDAERDRTWDPRVTSI